MLCCLKTKAKWVQKGPKRAKIVRNYQNGVKKVQNSKLQAFFRGISKTTEANSGNQTVQITKLHEIPLHKSVNFTTRATETVETTELQAFPVAY